MVLSHPCVGFSEFILAILARRGVGPCGLGGIAVWHVGALLSALLALLFTAVFQGRAMISQHLAGGALVQVLAVSLLLLLGAFVVAVAISSKLEADRMTADGRAMLERLGW